MRSPDDGRLVRLVLLPFPGLALWLALGYTLGDARRFSSPSFQAARTLGRIFVDHGDPMNAWGVLFLVGALVMGWAIVKGNNRALAAGLFIGGAIYLFWGTLFALSALGDPAANPNGPGVYWALSSLHFVGSWWLWVKR